MKQSMVLAVLIGLAAFACSTGSPSRSEFTPDNHAAVEAHPTQSKIVDPTVTTKLQSLEQSGKPTVTAKTDQKSNAIPSISSNSSQDVSPTPTTPKPLEIPTPNNKDDSTVVEPPPDSNSYPEPDSSLTTLSVNGSRVPPLQSCSEVEGGELCLYPPSTGSGSYTRGTTVYLAAFPNSRESTVTWAGADSQLGEIVSIEMTRNINLALTIDVPDKQDAFPTTEFQLHERQLNEAYLDGNGVEVVLSDLDISASQLGTTIQITYTLKNKTRQVLPISPWAIYLESGDPILKGYSSQCFIHPGQYFEQTWEFSLSAEQIPVQLGYPGRSNPHSLQGNDLLWNIRTSGRGSQAIGVYPAAVSYDEPLQLKLYGFRSGLALPHGSLSCDGVPLPIPGYNGVPGEIPIANELGTVKFETRLIDSGIDIGLVTIKAERRPFFSSNKNIVFKGAQVDILPIGGQAIINRPIVIAGSKFSSNLDNSPLDHAIKRNIVNSIKLNGKKLSDRYLDHPLYLSDSGNFITQILIPSVNGSDLGYENTISVEDNKGRIGRTALYIDSSRVGIATNRVCRGEEFEIHGSGFWASNKSLGIQNSVTLIFATRVSSDSGTYYAPSDVGTAPIDGFGRFKTTSRFPTRITPNTYFEIWAKPKFGNQTKAGYSVPGPSIKTSPASGLIGQELWVDIGGFPSNHMLPSGSLSMDGISLEMPGYFNAPGERPKTDGCGTINFKTKIPIVLPGVKEIHLDKPGGGALTTMFIVEDATAQITPNEVVLGQTVGFMSDGFFPKPKNHPPYLISGLHDSNIKIGHRYLSSNIPSLSRHSANRGATFDNQPPMYNLKINGVQFHENNPCISSPIELGDTNKQIYRDICVFPMPGMNGGFYDGTDITLGLFDSSTRYTYQWNGVNETSGVIAFATMNQDTNISLQMILKIDDDDALPDLVSGDVEERSLPESTLPESTMMLGVPYKYQDGTFVTVTAYNETVVSHKTKVDVSYMIENPTTDVKPSLRWKLFSKSEEWIIENGLFCEIPPGGRKSRTISFTFNTYGFEPYVLVYPGHAYSNVWGSTDLVWPVQLLSYQDVTNDHENRIEEDQTWLSGHIGKPYLTSDGMEVTLEALDMEPLGRGNLISISYRLLNKSGSSKKEKGWKLYYDGGEGLDQLIVSDTLALGDTVERHYKFFIPRGRQPIAIAYPGRMFEDSWRTEDLVWFIQGLTNIETDTTSLQNIELKARNAPYPITINNKGLTFFPLIIPINNELLDNRTLDIFATDTGGRSAVGHVSIAPPTIDVSSTRGGRGSLIYVSGQGFVNGDGFLGQKYYVDIFYGVERTTDNIVSKRDLESLIPVTTVLPDHLGGFKTNFRVPSDALPGSMNSIVAKVRELDIEARILHEIPDTELTISPGTISAGNDITVSGTGFPNNVQILRIAIGWTNVEFSSVVTDSVGRFTAKIRLPANLSSGNQKLIVSTREFSKTMEIKVS
jgi:hypothetical protein